MKIGDTFIIPNLSSDFESDCLRRRPQHTNEILRITVPISEMSKTIKMLSYLNGHWKLSERSAYYPVNGKLWKTVLKFVPRIMWIDECGRFDISNAIDAFKRLSKPESWSIPNFGSSESKPNKSFKDVFKPKTKAKYVKKPLTKKQLKARKKGKNAR